MRSGPHAADATSQPRSDDARCFSLAANASVNRDAHKYSPFHLFYRYRRGTRFHARTGRRWANPTVSSACFRYAGISADCRVGLDEFAHGDCFARRLILSTSCPSTRNCTRQAAVKAFSYRLSRRSRGLKAPVRDTTAARRPEPVRTSRLAGSRSQSPPRC